MRRRGAGCGRRRHLAPARRAGERSLPDLLRGVRTLPHGPQRELQRGGVHVDVWLRARRCGVGGFLSDLICVPDAEHMLVPLPQGLHPVALASASDNLSDAWRAVAPGLAAEPGPAVPVLGGASSGSIGLYAVALALALDASRVVYVDADEGRRRTAEELGAEALAHAPKRLGPFPIMVDSSAQAEGLAVALRSTAPGGTCTSTAIYFGEQPSLPLLEMYTKGITFKTGRV